MRTRLPLARLLMTGLGTGSACALRGVLLFYLLTATSMYLPADRVPLNLRHDAAAGLFVERPGYLVDRSIHADPFTDCTILLMAIHRGSSVIESTVSPTYLQATDGRQPWMPA